MARKVKPLVARNALELAEILGLDADDAAEMEVRAQLNVKIIRAVKKARLTHADVARKARTSRTRITAILNGNTSGVSTDLLLRILSSLGYRTKLSFTQSKLAA